MTTSVLKSVELFAGAGGLALGIAESDILRLKKALAYKQLVDLPVKSSSSRSMANTRDSGGE